MVSFNHWLSSIKPIRCQGIKRWLTLTMLRATGPWYRLRLPGTQWYIPTQNFLKKNSPWEIILFPEAELCQKLVLSNISAQLSLDYNILDLRKHFCLFTISSKSQQKWTYWSNCSSYFTSRQSILPLLTMGSHRLREKIFLGWDTKCHIFRARESQF